VREILHLDKPPIKEDRIYYWGNVTSAGLNRVVVCAQSRDIGNIASSQLAAEVIERWKPHFLLVVGIAGGISGRDTLELGDVVVGKSVAYYELQKISNGKQYERYLEIEPYSPTLSETANLIAKSVKWYEVIGISKPDEIEALPKVHRGIILSGDKLLGDPESKELKRLISEHPQAIAVEMESGGVARAAWEKMDLYHMGLLVVRGISDYCNKTGNQETRDNWRKYAARAAAAFTLNLIQTAKFVTIEKSAYEDYLKIFSRTVQSIPIPEVDFKVTAAVQDVSYGIEDLIKVTMDAGRVTLRAPAGGGKSVVLAKLSRIIANTGGIIPLFLKAGRWNKEFTEYYEEIKDYPQLFNKKLELLLKLSVADLPMSLHEKLPSNLERIVIVDGLNEVYGEEPIRQILDIVDQYVRENAPHASALVADRTAPRGFLGSEWKIAKISLLENNEVRSQIDTRIGAGAYSPLPQADKDLLRIPYFLNLALTSKSPILGSRAKSIGRFFAEQLGLDVQELDTVAKLAFEIYRDNKSPSFELEKVKELTGLKLWPKLSGALAEPVDGFIQFDHQLKHDYLVSRYLAQNPSLWGPPSFDAATFESNSFESLLMVLEQLKDTIQGDSFLKVVYDWNWSATVSCIANDRGNDPRHSQEIATAVLALIAEKIFDPVRRTAERAKNLLENEFPASPIVQKLKAAKSLAEIFAAVSENDSKKEWFLQWKRFFMRGESPPINEEEIMEIMNTDSIIGWTVANLLKRMPLSATDILQLRVCYNSIKADLSKGTVRWRIVHALGVFDSPENIVLLFNALDQDSYHWVRYGAVRSLIELAARTGKPEVRRNIIEKLIERVDSNLLSPKVIDEMGQSMFYRNPPSDWLKLCVPLLDSVRDEQTSEGDKERWSKLSANFVSFCEEQDT
jgi:nucleoside phosphorylase